MIVNKHRSTVIAFVVIEVSLFSVHMKSSREEEREGRNTRWASGRRAVEARSNQTSYSVRCKVASSIFYIVTEVSTPVLRKPVEKENASLYFLLKRMLLKRLTKVRCGQSLRQKQAKPFIEPASSRHPQAFTCYPAEFWGFGLGSAATASAAVAIPLHYPPPPSPKLLPCLRHSFGSKNGIICKCV